MAGVPKQKQSDETPQLGQESTTGTCACLLTSCPSPPPFPSLLCDIAGTDNVHNEHAWGPYDQCDMNKPHDWLKRARSNCYSCISGANVCTNPPTMLYHQF